MNKNDLLQTPSWVYKPLGQFDLDPCSGPETTIAKTNWWIERGENGLERDWFGFVWCNPPFSQKEEWAKKMIRHRNGILLLPERGSAPWFSSLAMKADFHFIMGKKIDFIGGSSSSNIGTALFLFGKEALNRITKSNLPGHLNRALWANSRNSNLFNQ